MCSRRWLCCDGFGRRGGCGGEFAIAGLVAAFSAFDDAGVDHVGDEVDGFSPFAQFLVLEDLRDDGDVGGMQGQLHGECLGVPGGDDLPVHGDSVGHDLPLAFLLQDPDFVLGASSAIARVS